MFFNSSSSYLRDRWKQSQMPLVTRSGRQTKAPPPPDYVRSYASKDQMAAESDVDDNQVMCYLLFALQPLLIAKALYTYYAKANSLSCWPEAWPKVCHEYQNPRPCKLIIVILLSTKSTSAASSTQGSPSSKVRTFWSHDIIC